MKYYRYKLITFFLLLWAIYKIQNPRTNTSGRKVITGQRRENTAVNINYYKSYPVVSQYRLDKN